MEQLTSKKVFNLLLEGRILESYQRYYRYNQEENKVEYSDTLSDWKESVITVNDFINVKKWNVLHT